MKDIYKSPEMRQAIERYGYECAPEMQQYFDQLLERSNYLKTIIIEPFGSKAYRVKALQSCFDVEKEMLKIATRIKARETFKTIGIRTDHFDIEEKEHILELKDRFYDNKC